MLNIRYLAGVIIVRQFKCKRSELITGSHREFKREKQKITCGSNSNNDCRNCPGYLLLLADKSLLCD
ncbi:MAG: hypothetical protein STSR0004_01570 [Peptococcaceae bacterium]